MEQVDEKKITIGELRDNFREILKSVFGYDHHYDDAQNYTINLIEHDRNGGDEREDIYTIADYRREFNEKYCEEVDILMWGESDSLIPNQTFEILDNLHTAA